jgi:hypothetical protein
MKYFLTQIFGFEQILYRFISFMTEIFRSAQISKISIQDE